MGYYSDVAIAINKETYNAHRLLKTVPRVLAGEPFKELNEAYYWFLTSQKWYDHFDEVREVMAFLNCLAEEEIQVSYGKPYLDRQGNEVQLQREPYGYLRVGEEHGDVEEHGSAADYDIFHRTLIDLPAEVS